MIERIGSFSGDHEKELNAEQYTNICRVKEIDQHQKTSTSEDVIIFSMNRVATKYDIPYETLRVDITEC